MNSSATPAGPVPEAQPRGLPVEVARALIAARLPVVGGVESLAVAAALGRVLADDVISPIDVPAHDNAAMDGYAFAAAESTRAGNAPLRLRVAGTALAGAAWNGTPGPGECVRIMTGAVMPAGCDTVVMQEMATREGDWVVLPGGQKPGQNRRRRGEDLQAEQPALRRGRLLRPADLGLLASLGIATVTVRRRLRVAFFSTGNELRSPGETLAAGCIYDSNRTTLRAMLERLGVEAIDLGLVRDDPAALEAVLNEAATRADAILTSGGVSVGEADFTRALLARLGEVAFWNIAMKPGRPFAFGRIGSAMLFGLPGNPVATMVAFYVFVREALLTMAGVNETALPVLRARCTSAIRKPPGRSEYQRGILAPGATGWEVRVTGAQGSGILRSMSEANCLILLPPEQGDVAPGETVDLWGFDGMV